MDEDLCFEEILLSMDRPFIEVVERELSYIILTAPNVSLYLSSSSLALMMKLNMRLSYRAHLCPIDANSKISEGRDSRLIIQQANEKFILEEITLILIELLVKSFLSIKFESFISIKFENIPQADNK